MNSQRRTLENKYINIDHHERDAVLRVLDTRELAGTASIVGRYENDLARYFGVKHALAVSSGTAALHLLLIMLDIGKGDEVILPPTAPIMTALPILAVGATPVFVDIEKASFGLDIDDLQAKISSKTKAIITVPMWGYPTRLDGVQEIARQYDIPLIEDASHSHGAQFDARLVGTHSDISFFSTQERKLICTGEGGFILTDNDEYADRIREVRDFGKPVRDTPTLAAAHGQYGYLFGLNFRITALSAALGIEQIKKLDNKIISRTSNAHQLRQTTQSIDWLDEWDVLEQAKPNYYSIVFRVRGKDARQIGRELSQVGVVSDTYRFDIKPLYELPLLSPFASDCANAAEVLRSIITLPTHEGLVPQDIQKITALISQIDGRVS